MPGRLITPTPAGIAFFITAFLLFYKWRRGTLPPALPAAARRLTGYWRVSTWTPPSGTDGRPPTLMEKALLAPVDAPRPWQHRASVTGQPPAAAAGARPMASMNAGGRGAMPMPRPASAVRLHPAVTMLPSIAENPLALNPVAEGGGGGGLWLDFGNDRDPPVAPSGGGGDGLPPPMRRWSGQEIRDWNQMRLRGGPINEDGGDIGRGL